MGPRESDNHSCEGKKMQPKLTVVQNRPLEKLSAAEARITGRPINTDPWMVGGGPRVLTPERVAKLAAENEQLRSARKAGK